MLLTGSVLPTDVPQHKDKGQEYLNAGLCVACGFPKESQEVYHCNACYAELFACLFDYDDD